MIRIPTTEFSFTYSRAQGAGGQNINKVNSKASLQWNIQASPSLSTEVKERFQLKFSRFIFGGMVVIHSQRFRTQKMNIDDCIRKLHALLAQVEFPPKARKETKPTKKSVQKRLQGKKLKSFSKKMRGKVNEW